MRARWSSRRSPGFHFVARQSPIRSCPVRPLNSPEPQRHCARPPHAPSTSVPNLPLAPPCGPANDLRRGSAAVQPCARYHAASGCYRRAPPRSRRGPRLHLLHLRAYSAWPLHTRARFGLGFASATSVARFGLGPSTTRARPRPPGSRARFGLGPFPRASASALSAVFTRARSPVSSAIAASAAFAAAMTVPISAVSM